MNVRKSAIGILALSLANPLTVKAGEPDLRERISEMERELARLKEDLPMERPQEPLKKETADILDREFRMDRGAAFLLSNVAGDIRLEAWDRPVIGVHAEKKGKGADEIEIRIRHDARDLQIETWHPRNFSWNWGRENPRVDYTVRLPRRLLGNVRIASVSGDVSLSETDAKEIRIKTISGNVTAERCQGALLLDTVSGDATAQIETDLLKAKTVSGDLRLTLTPSGEKRWELAANSVSGDVEVLLPKGSGARYAFTSMSGSARSRFPVTDAEHGRGRWAGTIGDGKGEISAHSVSGDLLLSEK